jgi:hypothetical protein
MKNPADPPANPRTQAAMPTRNLGKTGYGVGLFSLGGQSAVEKPNNFDVPTNLVPRKAPQRTATSDLEDARRPMCQSSPQGKRSAGA